MALVWLQKLESSKDPVDIETPVWKPKNPDCVRLFEESRQRHLSGLKQSGVGLEKAVLEEPEPQFWNDNLIPSYIAPEQVQTHINIDVWRELSLELEVSRIPGWERRFELAQEVLFQLENGVDSGVSGPGLLPINVENCFMEPDLDIPRVFDALMSAVKDGTMAGPLGKTEDLCKRINGFLSVPKPGGHRRQVGDLSRPKGCGDVDRSFNKNVDPNLKNCWPLEQLSAKKFSYMLLSMGREAIMGKSDLKNAYKCLPVSIRQRKLQRFVFAQKVFEDLRLIFGDTYAPMMFDRFHHVLLVAFVTTANNIPSCVWGKCIDDIPVVVPKERIAWLKEHFQSYRHVCEMLGVQISPIDNSEKSFEESQIGEVLGIVFDSVNMTWRLPERKKRRLVIILRGLCFKEEMLSLEQWEVVTGKLNNLCELWPPGRLFMDSFYRCLDLSRGKGGCFPNKSVKRDAKIWLSTVEARDLRVLPMKRGPLPDYILCFSDASGKILDTPGIGILIPAQHGKKARVAAWSYPFGFLSCVDEKGAKCYNKTTCLENIGMLSGLMLAPELL